MANQERRVPIKVVSPNATDFRKPESGGGSTKMFGEVTRETRLGLAGQLDSVTAHFQESFSRDPKLPAVARVQLKEKALAKSHRPTDLLDYNTCPIIGVDGLGQLLVSVQPTGLGHLKRKVLNDDTKKIAANLSTIERIEPYTAQDAVHLDRQAILVEKLARGEATLKFKLFRHGIPAADDRLLDELLRILEELEQPELMPLNYGSSLTIFRLSHLNEKAVLRLSSFVGTQCLSEFPEYHPVRTAAVPLRKMQPHELPPVVDGVHYPTIGIIDSGTDPSNPYLQAWVSKRYDYIPRHLQVNDHGSFVAALLINAKGLNHNDPRFPAEPAKIIDVVGLSPNESTTEDALVTMLDEVVPAHPEVRVWNLSLESSQSCLDSAFSDLAVKLDEMQTDHDIQIVFAAGNQRDPRHYHPWPRPHLAEIDRLSAPADSARGIAVGSIAHAKQHSSLSNPGDPSPFSRRGPGATFLPKPDVVHFGGNCDKTGSCTQVGIISINGAGSIAEDIGTSFSTPLVSSILANVDASMVEPPSTNLLKAMMIHSAVLNSPQYKKEDFRYRGFGTPSDAFSVLTCVEWAATMIFELQLQPGLEFVKHPFPIPKCLRKPTGEVIGEIAMTLVYDPPLDATFGAEYCRRNVEVSLGTYEYDVAQEKRVHSGQVPLVPKNLDHLYEKARVEAGFKWSPVKVYRRVMPKGVAGEDWRLKVWMMDRSGYSSTAPQDVALIITLIDPEKKLPVYNDLVTAMSAGGWVTQDLELRPRLRSQGGPDAS